MSWLPERWCAGVARQKCLALERADTRPAWLVLRDCTGGEAAPLGMLAGEIGGDLIVHPSILLWTLPRVFRRRVTLAAARMV